MKKSDSPSKVLRPLLDEAILQKSAQIKDIIPRILDELDKIDRSMQNVKDLIRPHTTLNRACDGFPVLSQDFDVYKRMLHYQRDQLCDLLEQDLIFWKEKEKETAKFKTDIFMLEAQA